MGFERAGIETVWQVECEEYCRWVLARHFPSAVRYDDVRTVGKHNLSPVDIISGGFPCQDISNAGKRVGIDGERSGLWSEYSRIIRELRPRYVVVENVAALLGRGMERVLGDLAACGYDAEWQSIRASDVGAPHRRERIWIVAYPTAIDVARRRRHPGADQRDAECVSQIPNGSESDVADADSGRFAMQGKSSGQRGFTARGGENVPNAASVRCSHDKPFPGIFGKGENERRLLKSTGNGHWAIEPDVGRVAHGVPRRVDRLKGLGNAIVPQITEFLGRKILEAENGNANNRNY